LKVTYSFNQDVFLEIYMIIAKKLGLEVEIFCRMVITTKMLFSNVLGHAAELHYEKYLKLKEIKFTKAPTDTHYDYIVVEKRDQVKRWETDTTNDQFLGVNLTTTHGNRNGPDAFYTKTAFDNLVLFDVGFKHLRIIPIKDVPTNNKYSDRLTGKYKLNRNAEEKLELFDKEFLNSMKVKNSGFPEAIEELRKKYKYTYLELLEKCCNLTIVEIDSLFTEDNFRLVVGAKGFAAEEHFNVFLEKNKISFRQDKRMYSKVDHWIKDKIRVQVKIPNERANDELHWGVKTHKSHGHGVGELYKADVFDILALFIGFKMNLNISKYIPDGAELKFLFIPIRDLEKHPEFSDHLKRISKIRKDKYKVNDLSMFK